MGFESLLRDGKIRLRRKDNPRDTFLLLDSYHKSVCRGLVLSRIVCSPTSDDEHCEVELSFEPEQPRMMEVDSVYGGKKYMPLPGPAPADFDAMLRAMEPYEVVEPETDACPKCGCVAWRIFDDFSRACYHCHVVEGLARGPAQIGVIESPPSEAVPRSVAAIASRCIYGEITVAAVMHTEPCDLCGQLSCACPRPEIVEKR